MSRAAVRAALRPVLILAACGFAFGLLPGSALANGLRLANGPRIGRTLRIGMRGADVRTLQRELTRVGLRTPVSGRFGAQTAGNVARFERQCGLRANGVAGPLLVRELDSVLEAGSLTAVADLSHASRAGGGGSGGSAIPSSSPKPRHRPRPKRTTTTSTSSGTTDGVTAPVKRDGGSEHLGERTLRPGMHGHDVRVLQGYLTVAGLPTPVDGSFGASTEAHVVKFEAAHSLRTNGDFTYADSLVLRQAVVLATAGGAIGKATITSDGTANAPAGAPALVVKMITAANRLIHKPYIYAGGHGRWNDSGYDCSGAVSYALHGAGLLSSSEDSTGLESFGSSGPGRWVTIYADAGHTWVVIAGIAFDTAHYGNTTPGGSGPRWLSNPTGNLADGGNYVVRHPAGL